MNNPAFQSYASISKDVREILLTPEQIQTRISEIGRQISIDYAEQNLLMVGVLKGVLMFMADLLRQITIPVEIDFIAVSSYSAAERDQGYVRLVKDLDIPITDRHVIFIEDVIDTGLTLNYLLRNLRARNPSSLEVCVMFDKPKRRLVNIPLRYKGFELSDQFVVGYGLDYREKYRNLPFVGLLKAEAF